MIIDVNATLGPYPFRRLRHTTADELVAQLDRQGIDRAVVSSLPGVFYRDAHAGNEAVLTAAQAHPARLIPVAVVNPTYAGWRHDLMNLGRSGVVKAVALWPEHHSYALKDNVGRYALEMIVGLDLPVVLTQRLEDRRQRHRFDLAEDLTVASLLEAARSHPKLRFLLVNWAGLDGAALAAAGLKGRCLIDFARLQVVNRKEVPKLIAALGVEAIAFGSHLPFDYVGPALVKLANLETLPAGGHERIAWRNAAEFLRLKLGS
jgi:predicted TIM-barrel fold metal-dependent hydrolase